MLQVYNTLTKQKAPFQPIIPGQIGLYVCGMTVYDYCHIGHARVLVSFDVISRYLRSQGYNVTYIRNVTDIDDKIIQRAQQNEEAVSDLTARFIAAMHEDATKLGVLPPTKEPRATDHIPEMVSLIQTLIAKGYAYVADNGDVYYAVHQFKPYGCLAHQDPDQLRSGARVAVSEIKRDPLDFVLWKLAKPGEPTWESPWGLGRPGWHIECSAMSMQCLGQHFDMHGGGFDLIFPHHENEIAQSEGATEEKFVNTWMHVGFLQIDKEKMSKSLGNFFTIRDVLAEWPAEVVRYFLMSGHYRSPLNYSTDALANAHGALMRFYTALRGLPELALGLDSGEINYTPIPMDMMGYEQRFKDAMDDDFNTPDALGLLTQDPEVFLQKTVDDTQFIAPADIEDAIKARLLARQNKNWAEADRIRDDLLGQGVVLEDSPQGTTWRRGS
jgi:cysteinyl-tRNA synthetase